MIYITFNIPYFYKATEKYAVACEDLEQAKDVASDVYSFDGVKYVRFRKCGKPLARKIFTFNEYWKYNF